VHKITAPLIDGISFSTRNQKRRQKRLAVRTPESEDTRTSLANLSSNSINIADSLEEVEAAQENRRRARDACRRFENADCRIRDVKTQENRTGRVYASLTVQQRKLAKETVSMSDTD
jgi:septal ring factor EnvC (AmiA/AmiB activator)